MCVTYRSSSRWVPHTHQQLSLSGGRAAGRHTVIPDRQPHAGHGIRVSVCTPHSMRPAGRGVRRGGGGYLFMTLVSCIVPAASLLTLSLSFSLSLCMCVYVYVCVCVCMCVRQAGAQCCQLC